MSACRNVSNVGRRQNRTVYRLP